mgnify:CR=1 FL=1
MKNTDLVVGQRYSVSHGSGIYVGYEEFYAKGWKSRVVEETPPEGFDGRYAFKLDEPNKWINIMKHSGTDKKYYTWIRYITRHNLVQCGFCGVGTLKLIGGDPPYTPDHWQCPKCDSTYSDKDGEPVK